MSQARTSPPNGARARSTTLPGSAAAGRAHPPRGSPPCRLAVSSRAHPVVLCYSAGARRRRAALLCPSVRAGHGARVSCPAPTSLRRPWPRLCLLLHCRVPTSAPPKPLLPPRCSFFAFRSRSSLPRRMACLRAASRRQIGDAV